MRFKIIIIFFFLFYSGQVSAIGIGVKPLSLDLELEKDEIKTAEISVYNISQEAGIFQIFPDELQDWIKIEPNNFRLEAGESKEIKIEILAKEKGGKTTNLSVSVKPLDHQSFSVSPGLKIPLRLNVSGKEYLFLASISEFFNQNLFKLSIGILIIILIIFLLLKYSKRRKKFIVPPDNLPVGN